MIKKLLFLLTFLPLTIFAQFSDDFEDGNISNWTQSTSDRWDASTVSPLNGSYSLHHVFDNSAAGTDQVSIELPIINLTSQTIVWRFRLKHGYAPSSSNNWSVFFASDADANQMFPTGSINGYALGVNLTGSDDTLRLWKINTGVASQIISTSINWEDNVGSTEAPAIEIVRLITGEWGVNINLNGNFNSLINRIVQFLALSLNRENFVMFVFLLVDDIVILAM